MAIVHQVVPIYKGITCHAWNHDKTMLAICPKSNELHIYGNCQSNDTSAWVLLQTLSEHDLPITGVDWSSVHNRLVTCSADRNSFVWTYEKEAWQPALVVLNIDRAAVGVQWSPNGLKFACATSAKCVPVCFYEPSNNWWVSKLIKKHKSTVLAISWHPNSQLIATACCDFKARVCSTYLDNIDEAPNQPLCYPQPLPFGEVYGEFPCAGWVTSISWSPSGNVFSFTGQDSTIHFISLGGEQPIHQTIRLACLPFNAHLFLSEKVVVGGGHDFSPFLFAYSEIDKWSLHSQVQDRTIPAPPDKLVKSSSGISDKLALFQSKITRGQDEKEENKDAAEELKHHESAITCMQNLQNSKSGSSSKFSTSSVDGRIVVWNLDLLDINMALLSL